MYRIRFHGRGGQGMKTASRIMGTAFFLEGYEVQDAPRYGAERRGAPIFAYVRASKEIINERGVINDPDLVVVADDSLVSLPASGILSGVNDSTVILINTSENVEIWKNRLAISSKLITLPAEAEEQSELKFVGAECAGASARISGVISKETLIHAIKIEVEKIDPSAVQENLSRAVFAYDLMAEYEGCLEEKSGTAASGFVKPDWIELPFDNARISAPDIHASANSVEVKTGLWRTVRPVIDAAICKKCWWICSTFCPDGAINVKDQHPEIDYDHCKGCMVCVAQCPTHAIEAIPEQKFQNEGDIQRQGADKI